MNGGNGVLGWPVSSGMMTLDVKVVRPCPPQSPRWRQDVQNRRMMLVFDGVAMREALGNDGRLDVWRVLAKEEVP